MVAPTWSAQWLVKVGAGEDNGDPALRAIVSRFEFWGSHDSTPSAVQIFGTVPRRVSMRTAFHSQKKRLMNYVHIVAVLAILQFFLFGVLVGRARKRYAIAAPATSGHELFERAFRVQMNTLEQLVAFLPALLIAALYWPNAIIASIGAVYLIGRFVYRQQYVADPAKRAPGFLLTVLPTFTLLGACIIGAIM